MRPPSTGSEAPGTEIGPNPPSASPRIEPLAQVPLFWRLAGRRAVVAGSGAAAAWKAELLAAAGAMVDVFAAAPSPELLDSAGHESVTLNRRGWQPADLDGAALAVGECGDDAAASAFADAARARGVPVNVIDRPAFCDFQFGAIVNRSPVVVGIATDGGAPILAQAIRRRIEALLPRRLADWGAGAQALRARVAAALPARADRRAFWEAYAAAALAGSDDDPATAGERLIAAAPSRFLHRPTVIAAPAHPDGLTLGDYRMLQAAEIVVHDAAVPPAVLELGRREARRLAAADDDAATAALVERLAAEGTAVLWLRRPR
jgi:uroporphyrin-III C-methyltransferase/precorrin-2 dehydrogenase/sirohydrochlorin ferrochelatase